MNSSLNSSPYLIRFDLIYPLDAKLKGGEKMGVANEEKSDFSSWKKKSEVWAWVLFLDVGISLGSLLSLGIGFQEERKRKDRKGFFSSSSSSSSSSYSSSSLRGSEKNEERSHSTIRK